MNLSRFPDENLLDIFIHLDRASLEKLQLLCHRFRDVIDAELQHVCLRPILTASLELRAYKTYVLEVEQYRPPTTAGKSCICGASEATAENANHFLSDWLIRERGLIQLRYWEPCRVTYKYCHTPDDMEGKPRWCKEGRPLWGEDLEKFFREHFEWTYRPPRYDALIECSWVERDHADGPRRWNHWYYGNQTHCEAGVDVGLVRGEDFHCFNAHYFDKVNGSSLSLLIPSVHPCSVI
ncbi:hypothetical protein AAVH_20361 [Aphelenchoides avenae]|nr:hypothetical protein AAVH_20361 [Aphelenchus avenae]